MSDQKNDTNPKCWFVFAFCYPGIPCWDTSTGSCSEKCSNTDSEQLILSFVNLIQTFKGLSLDLTSLGEAL